MARKQILAAEPMTFEQVRDAAVADLRAVEMLFSNAAEAVEKGDIGQVDTVVSNMGRWAQMLLIRHDDRMSRRTDIPFQERSEATK